MRMSDNLDLNDGYMSIYACQNASSCMLRFVHFLICTIISKTKYNSKALKKIKMARRGTSRLIILKIILTLGGFIYLKPKDSLVFAGSLGNLLELVGGPVTGLLPRPHQQGLVKLDQGWS